MSKNFTPSWIGARQIMGLNFFGIEEAMRYYAVRPTEQQLSALEKIPFSVEDLRRCKDTYILAAVFPISVLAISCIKNIELRNDFSNRNILLEDQRSLSYRGDTRWELIRKHPITWSVNKPWHQQTRLLGQFQYVPKAQSVVYTAVGHFLYTKERLLQDVLVRCLDHDSNMRRVYVGFMDLYDNMSITVGSNIHYSSFNEKIGISVARKNCDISPFSIIVAE